MLLNIKVSDETLIQKEFLIQPISRASFVFLHVDGEKTLYKYLSRIDAKEQSCLCSLFFVLWTQQWVISVENVEWWEAKEDIKVKMASSSNYKKKVKRKSSMQKTSFFSTRSAISSSINK